MTDVKDASTRIADMIEDAPTAYYVDDVVEKLEEVKNKDT